MVYSPFVMFSTNAQSLEWVYVSLCVCVTVCSRMCSYSIGCACVVVVYVKDDVDMRSCLPFSAFFECDKRYPKRL